MAEQFQDKKKDAVALRRRQVALQAEFGKVYIQERGGKILEPIRADMNLDSRLGQLYEQDGKVLVTAAGYWHLNKTAAISIVNAGSVVVDGRQMGNPYIYRNPETKAVEGVAIRKLGIGFAPTGQLVVVDRTLYFNTWTYFLQSIQAKMSRMVWAKNAQSGRFEPTDRRKHPDCAEYGVKDQPPDKARGGRWVFYPIEGPLGVWVNFLDSATLECLKEHTQRQRFGERIASTIIDRNIFKSHPAIAVAEIGAIQVKGPEPEAGEDGEHGDEGGGKPKGRWQKKVRKEWRGTVTVYGWRHTLEVHDLTAILKAAEADQLEEMSGQVNAGVIVPEVAELKAAETEVASEDGPELDTTEEDAPADEVPGADELFKEEKQAAPPAAAAAPAEKRFTPADRAKGERPK